MAGMEIEEAWDSLHDALPPGWRAGRPSYREDLKTWEQYAYDTRERPEAGKRSREWTAVGSSEAECVREMARCLGEIGAGRWPV